jgi:hypothetical protein
MGRKAIDLTGKRFGRLLVLEKTNKRSLSRNITWKCQCDCGNITEVLSNKLIKGHTQSCGCLRKKVKIVKNKDGAAVNMILGVLKSTNTSGVSGVRYHNHSWEARIGYANKEYYLIKSKNINDCIAVRKEAEEHVKQGDFLEWIAGYKIK